MKIQSAQFLLSAPDLSACPEPGRAEVAFIGRSNVGKSSLINLLTRQKDLAKVSATPGKTKLINFFTINDAWHLVDLPGYGYAQVARVDRARFSRTVAEYLERRENLRWVFVLIDSRLSPQPIDLAFLHWLAGRNAPFSLIFTKTDKIKPSALIKAQEVFLESLAEFVEGAPDIFATSTKTGEGRDKILGFIDEALKEQD